MTIGFRKEHFLELVELEAGNFWFQARNKLIIWAMHRYAPLFKNFLEIGCGTGFVLSAIACEFPGIKLAGSEYLEEGLIYARQRLPRVDITQMDARIINQESVWDAIGAFDVLEHIQEDEQVLFEIAKALKPSGMLFLTVPQHPWLWSIVDECVCHVRRYKAEDLHQKIYKAGFEILYSTSFVSLLLPAMYASRMLKAKDIKANIKIDGMAELRINNVLNKILSTILTIELGIIRLGFSFPAGGSRLIIARKLKAS